MDSKYPMNECVECGCAEAECGNGRESVKRYESHMLSDPRSPYKFHFGNTFFTPHWHENLEILYFHGECTFFCDREEYKIKAHDIAVVNSNALHGLPRSGGYEHDCLIVDAVFLAKSGIDLADLSFKCIIQDEEIERLFFNVENEVRVLRGGDSFGEAAVKAAILALVVRLCRDYSCYAEGERVRGGTVRRAMGYIKSHFDEPLTVDSIAAEVNVSKYYFCREFHNETGYTVVRYINNLRCLEAQKLLREGNYTVGEVAHRCGFENLSYFTRTYKAIIGCTPTSSRAGAE